MKKKIKPIPKNKKCRCGKRITHHHHLCNSFWILDNQKNKLLKKAMEKNKKNDRIR